MKFSRWYDKYPNLKSIISILEKVDEDSIELISQDFLQVIMQKYNDKLDTVIKSINSNPPPRYGRWYDKNYNLHTCIEFIKTIDDNEKDDLINALLTSLLSFIEDIDND